MVASTSGDSQAFGPWLAVFGLSKVVTLGEGLLLYHGLAGLVCCGFVERGRELVPL